MKNILKSDIYKLLRDKQSIAIIIIYSILILIDWPANVFSLSTSELLDLGTMDYGFILLIVTLTASSAFSLDYSNDALKDVLPYYSRKEVYQAKWVIVILTATITQFFCYLLGFFSCVVITKTLPSSADLGLYFNRFIVHYFLNLTNISFILFLSSFFKRRAFINALSLISILLIRFLPIGNGQFLFNYLNAKYYWGASIDFIMIIFLLIITFVFIVLGYHFFRKREV